MPFRHHDLRLLMHLEALLETASVSEAAERIGISQPAMSRILARLRDQLEDPLLVRSGAGMVLTPRAEALAAPLKSWLASGEILLSPTEFDPAASARTFRVASSDFGILSVIRPALGELSSLNAKAEFRIEALTVNSVRDLVSGQLDLVVTGFHGADQGVQYAKLFDQGYLAICRRGHPLLEEPITTERLLKWPHISTHIGSGFDDPLNKYAALQDRRIKLTAPNFTTAPYLVSDSDAVATLPAYAARQFAQVHGLDVFELPIRMQPFSYYVAWHERSGRDPATRWMVERFRSACHKTLSDRPLAD